MLGLILAAVLGTANPPGIGYGVWALTEGRDALTDQRMVGMTQGADGNSLVVMCQPPQKGLRVGLLTKAFLGDRVGRHSFDSQAQWRFDQDPPEEKTVLYGAQEMFIYGGDAIKFAGRMRSAKSILFRLYDFEGNAIDLRFDLTGADGAVPDLFARCGVKAAP